MMIRRVTQNLIFIVTLFVGTAASAQMICPLPGQEPQPKTVADLSVFAALPVLEEGRVKPAETYARNLLLRFSGRRGASAEWLARLLFAPDTTRDDKIFLINSPEIANALGIEPENKRRYSFRQLEPGFEKLHELAAAASQINEKQRSLVEQELIRLYENLQVYAGHSRTFVFAFPHPDFSFDDPGLNRRLGLPEGQQQFSFLDIALKAERLYEITAGLERKPREMWGPADQNAMTLISNLFHWSFAYKDLPFQIIPSYQEDENWLSPWDAIAAALPSPDGRREITALRNALLAYWAGDQLNFDLTLRAFEQSIHGRIASHGGRIHGLQLELLYNRLNLFFWAKLLYALTFFLFLAGLIIDRRWIYQSGWLMALGGFFLHTTAIVMRMIILSRPPVSTLYETFVFVGFIAVLMGLVIERFHRQWLGLVTAAISGCVFLLIAAKFGSDGDTLKMLIAVLNSNFWLSTHVTTITIGYAGACVAGLIGHIYLLQRAVKPGDAERLKKTYSILLGALGFGLTMTFLGTNLGGIWADQSWGRFWGWDPKENGALLIILWTAMIFHAKIGGMIKPLGVAVCSVLGIIVVMWAWFGVNLLSIGLHSYGFTSGVAMGLIIYVVAQLLILAGLLVVIRKKESAGPAA